MKVDVIFKDISREDATRLLMWSQTPKPESFDPEPFGESDVPATDVTGLPWDERIHASTKAINSDGTWKKRRGVQEIEYNRVEAEIRATLPTPEPEQPVQPITPLVSTTEAMFSYVNSPQVQPLPEPVYTFDQLMATIQNLFMQQLITPDYMNGLNQLLGVASITDITGSPEKIKQVFDILKNDGKIQ